MKVKDLRLHWVANRSLNPPISTHIELLDQGDCWICSVYWGSGYRTKLQAIAIANWLCDRFNSGQKGKP